MKTKDKLELLGFTLFCIVAATILLFVLSSCAHVPITCDAYCGSRGGVCRNIEKGYSIYNTATGRSEEEPTRFVCEYRW